MLRSALAAALLCLCAGPVFGQAFTYQGELLNAGVPVAAAQDVQFKLFDSATGNVQVGVTSFALGTTPINGRFTATVSPGNAVFTGADRWLEIAVKPAGSGTYTTLSPRQKIAAAPYASRSLADRWVQSGAFLRNDAQVNRVGINRSAPLTGADYFTVATPTGAGAYGGMYIETAAEEGWPFYGFATGGVSRAWTYYDGQTGAWKLNVSGDRVTVNDAGRVGIGAAPAGPEAVQVAGNVAVTGTVKAAGVLYPAPQTRTLALLPEDFRPAQTGLPGVFGGGPVPEAYFDASVGYGEMLATFRLPQGATLTSLRFYAQVGPGSPSLTLEVLRRAHGSITDEFIGELIRTNSGGQFVEGPPQINSVIDNDNYAYLVKIRCTDWAGTSTTVRGVRIRYTVTGPE